MTLTPLLTLTNHHQVKDNFIILQKLNTWTFSVAVWAKQIQKLFFPNVSVQILNFYLAPS
jgi:hypothetical protein